MRLRRLTAEQVTFTVDVQEDCDAPVRGNAIASGDDAYDKQVEDEILDRLHRGDSFAWCTILVKATWKGFTGHASLGGNSLSGESEVESTITDHALRDEALESLNKALENTLTELQETIEP